MFTHLALSALVLVSSPQATKHKKKTPPTSDPAVAAPSKPRPSISSGNVIRTADCVMVLKGQMVRLITMTIPRGGLHPKAKTAGSEPVEKSTPPLPGKTIRQQTLENFEYELPGVLQEETDPKSTKIRFKFTPSKGDHSGLTQAKLHLEDQSKGPGFPPTVADATEVTGADPFIFEAAARGQQLVPVAGTVILNARIQDPAPTGAPISMVAPVRPVVSIPLPALSLKMGQGVVPSLQFQGISLWAWPNSKGPFTVASTVVYDLSGPQGSIKGNVDVSFRLGATR